jgi:hypothetical protein
MSIKPALGFPRRKKANNYTKETDHDEQTTRTIGNKKRTEYSERITNEIKREHHQRLSRDDSLDLKCGVILGFVILVLVQIILSSEVTASLAKDLAILAPFTSATTVSSRGSLFWGSFLSMATFVVGFALLLCAAIFGFHAISLRLYPDVKIKPPNDPEKDLFDQYRSYQISASTVDSRVANTFLTVMPKIEESSNKKAVGIEWMLKLFVLGIFFMVAHFFATIIFTVLSS